MENDQEQKIRPVIFYGKKVYRLHPLIARKKPPEIKIPNYRDEQVEKDKDR